MVALIAADADIAEEVELGRTLLLQGHLDTAQRVMLKVCQEQPDHAEAFRVLAMVLSKRGDDRRARPLFDYADELDAQRTREIPAAIDDVPSDAETKQNRLAMQAAIPSAPAAKPAGRPAVGTATGEPASPASTQTPPVAADAASSPSLASLPKAPKSRAGLAIFAAIVLCAGLAVGAVAAYKLYGKSVPPRPSPREELDRALASGTLEVLMRARDVARMTLETGAPDVDSQARLGLLDAFLVDDYAVEARKDAEEALRRAEAGPGVNKERAAIVATARSLLAHAAGERAEAKQFADKALTAPDPPAFALLASARVRSLAGDAAWATRDLDRAMGMSPELAPVVVDWATSRLDGGDPVAARQALITVVSKYQGNSRALLVLAEAERALGEPNWVRSVEKACRSDAKISHSVRADCAIESALQARLDGDRAGAVRKAKAISQTSEDPQVLGQASLLLALLGETDAAEGVLDRARKVADAADAPLQWADQAIRLSRREAPQASNVLEHPAGPERDLVALRAAYARAGSEGLSTALKLLPPGIQDIDWDVRAYTALGQEGGPPKPELMALQKRADKGNPVASYVLGVLAMRDKDFKLAMRRLEKALAGHGDACQAAALYLDAVKRAPRGTQPNKAGLRGIHARNAKCPVPDM